MGLIIKQRKHLYTRIPLGLLIIVFLSFSPVLMSIIGGMLTEWFTGSSCNEGNCFWGALGWLTFWTVPLGILVAFIFLIIVIVDAFKLKR